MFGIFKKKNPIDKLQAQYEKLMSNYHKLSTTNRAASDAAYAKANEIADQIEALKNK